MSNDIEVLISLNNLYTSLSCKNEKRTIKRLIDKRPLPFLIDIKSNFTEKELGYGRMFIHKIFNIKAHELNELFNDKYFIESMCWYRKDHWLIFDEDYKKLTLIRTQFNKQKESIIKRKALELLNIYTEQQVELIIKKHYNL